MKITKKIILGHIRDIIIITLVSFAISMFFVDVEKLNLHNISINALYSMLIGGTLWKGNEATGYFIGTSIPQNKNPGFNLRMQVTGMVIFTITDILIVNYIWFGIIYDHDFWNFVVQGSGLGIFLIQFIVAMLIGLIFYVNGYFNAWKASLKNEEAFKRERLILQYEALKNQVNPHFLFNSLNTLSSLVYVDVAKADRFIKKLSMIYRYVLEQRNKDLIDLDSEMEFVRNYVDLQKIRFENNLLVDININNSPDARVIPISVQMLVENAIKHNVVSEERPLKIEIFTNNDGYLMIRNNWQKKRSIKKQEGQHDWTHIGLPNLKSRYEYLTDREFIVNDPEQHEEEPGYFEVKVPLVKNESET
ncbi:MAG: histidine kinase [Bacteroidales bacterium]|nr:histidine kinase [Bacteroidales bacterium]